MWEAVKQNRIRFHCISKHVTRYKWQKNRNIRQDMDQQTKRTWSKHWSIYCKNLGLYHFTAVGLTVHDADLYLHLWHNYLKTAWAYVTDGGYKMINFNVVFELNINDRVYVRCTRSNCQSIYSDEDNFNTFSGNLIL